MRILWRVLVVLVLIAAILGIGVYAYNIGMAQGLAQKVQARLAIPRCHIYIMDIPLWGLVSAGWLPGPIVPVVPGLWQPAALALARTDGFRPHASPALGLAE